MAKITLYIAMSLDGFIAAKDGSVAWLDAFNASGEDYGYKEFLAGIDTVVMGNTTYKQILGFGTYPYTEKTGYVFAHREGSDEHATFVQGDVKDFVSDLAADESVWLVGGAHLADQFLKEGLIDTFRLFVMPVLLGEGIRLFANSGVEAQLVLKDTVSYNSGAVELCYTVD